MNAGGDQDNKRENINTRQISNETGERELINKDSNKDYYESDEEGIGTDGDENKIFATEEAKEISQLLARHQHIQDAQVATVGDQVIVSVALKNHTRPNNNMLVEMEREIKEIVPNKEVLLYTDERQWNRMKDLDAGLKQREAGKSVEEFIEKYFNIDVKD